jgi:hypothetical protein
VVCGEVNEEHKLPPIPQARTPNVTALDEQGLPELRLENE